MAGITDLICKTADGKLSFGNFDLDSKQKRSDFPFEGDLYKVKTCQEITKLERNGLFVYESVPGTAVSHFSVDDAAVEFSVEGDKDAQVTIQLEDDCEYEVFVDGAAVGGMKTNLSGKLVVSVELNQGAAARIRVVKR